MNEEIKLVRYITLRYADPICAIDLTDRYLIYGTMLGTVACYIINQKKLITLSESQEENVSGIKIQENKKNQKESKIFVSIGDEKILLYNSIGENLNEIPKYEEIYNYLSENDHNKKCEKCYTMLKNNYLVRTFIEFPNEVKTPSHLSSTEISIKNLLNLNEKEIQVNINMSNYCVPFDFDGEKYVFVDFLEEKKRMFEIYDIKNQNHILNFEIEKYKEKIGHISLLQLLKNNTIFLVRDYNICEIRNLQFDLLRAFNVNQNEILAYDIYYQNEDDPESFIIYLLDITCNVLQYSYKNNKMKHLINLNNLDIDQVIKDQKYFSMGYPYYIKVSKHHMAISSDYGCLLLLHNISAV